jgi:hypothetical protein
MTGVAVQAPVAIHISLQLLITHVLDVARSALLDLLHAKAREFVLGVNARAQNTSRALRGGLRNLLFPYSRGFLQFGPVPGFFR